MTDRLVLAYHGVRDDSPGRFDVTADQFAMHVRQLRRRRYTFVTFAELVGSATGRVAAITFDDALASVHTEAFPVLAAHGAAATVFVPTSYVGGELPFADGRPAMGWDELSALRDAGWELASHTHTHASLPPLADDALAFELSESKAQLERRFGAPCRTLAYPYGATDDRVRAAAAAAGYEAAADFPPRFAKPTPFGWPRVGIYRQDGGLRFLAKTARVARAVRTLR